ncbi:uncharacterized protein LOC125155065 [Prionailurus viverrinus]|uniref:uncharacterized protein LOC125155065 n=1 Tax=Prionailurus viverrinus TaxID=61388 RepID=UPI001FF65509|nr:uncharacterized protein LOC125155065 [Prionailurus viverrinus]
MFNSESFLSSLHRGCLSSCAAVDTGHQHSLDQASPHVAALGASREKAVWHWPPLGSSDVGLVAGVLDYKGLLGQKGKSRRPNALSGNRQRHLSHRGTPAGVQEPASRAGAGPERECAPPSPGPAPPLQFRVLSVGAAAVWAAAKGAQLRGPGFQPGLFPGRAPAWLPPGLRVGTVPRCRVPDGPWRLCSPSLPQATPADMFAKAFRVKSNTAIKGSDRRKLRAHVMAAFPTLGTDQVSVLVPGKEELTIVKLFAHRGDAVTVYVSGGNPILFEVEKNLYPTVYALWSYPDLLPAFTMWPPVLEKLVGGADLMLPGLVVPPAGLPQVQKGDLCAIALLGNRVAAPVCILTNIARGFPSLHIFTNTCCFLCCLC